MAPRTSLPALCKYLFSELRLREKVGDRLGARLAKNALGPGQDRKRAAVKLSREQLERNGLLSLGRAGRSMWPEVTERSESNA